MALNAEIDGVVISIATEPCRRAELSY
jgi:hypothetical protein